MADSTAKADAQTPLDPDAELRPERLGQASRQAPPETSELRPERLGHNGAGRVVSEPLRPERLGQRMAAGEGAEPLSAERVRELLKSHAPWELADDGSALRRSRLFPTIRAAVSYVQLVAEIGEAHGYLPEIDLRHHEVTLRVDTNDNAGLTELDFDMARVLAEG